MVDWCTIRVPRIAGRSWPGRPLSPILSVRASGVLRDLALELQAAGVRGTGGRAVDIHDAAEWLFGEIAKASVAGDDTDPGGESDE